jgi:hypothetical protein
MIRPSPGRRRSGVRALWYGFRAFQMLGSAQLEHAVHGPAGALGAGRHEVRVGPQREARIGVAQVLGQGLDRLTTVEQHRGIEMLKRMNLSARFGSGTPARRSAGFQRKWLK